MNRLKNNSLYFATDKDLFDLFTSAKKRISTDIILELARDRGIFLSKEEAREDLIDYLCLLPHDYYDLHSLLGHTETPSRKENSTCSAVDRKISTEELHRAILEIEQERAERFGECYIPSAFGEDRFELDVGYTEVDYSRTRLRQKRPREAKIEFEIEDDKVTIRSPANEKSKEIVTAILDKVSLNDDDFQPREIDLSALRPVERTLFFTNMIKCIDGYDLADVTKVDVDRRINPNLLPFDDNGEESEDSLSEESDKMLGIVQHALLQGEGLLHSPEYQGLSKRGFYICNIVWLVQESTPSGNRVEFSASLSQPESGTGFRYAVRGIYRRKSDSSLTKTARPVESQEERVLRQLLEAAAWEALSQVRSIDSESST